MKNTRSHLRSLTSLGVIVFSANIAAAQTTAPTTTTTTSTTSSDGTVSQFGPETFVVKSTTSTTPLNYSYSKTTTYVDENGNPVSSETVKSGAPVTVYYTQDGDRMVATRVIVRKATTTTDMGSQQSTVTTSDGTVSEYGPETFAVKSTTSTTPVNYSYSKTTTYVDENGNTVSSELVKSGAPVTVYYTQDGDKMVATKVIVRKTTTTTSSTP